MDTDISNRAMEIQLNEQHLYSRWFSNGLVMLVFMGALFEIYNTGQKSTGVKVMTVAILVLTLAFFGVNLYISKKFNSNYTTFHNGEYYYLSYIVMLFISIMIFYVAFFT